MAGEQDDITVICATATAKNMRLTPGSTRDTCAGCRRSITVSPQGRAVEPDEGFEKRYLCIRCAQAEDPEGIAEAAPGALEAAAKVIGQGQAIALGSRMRRTKLKDIPPDMVDGDA
jgi:hypothetical protein